MSKDEEAQSMANQITVRLDDEEYVRSVWERVSCVDTPLNGWVVCAIVGGNVRTAIPLTGSICCTEAEAWSAAAEFTRERLEQVRQAKLSARCLAYWGSLSKGYPGQIEAFQHLTTLLNAELATLTRGMKPEALEGATR